MPVRTYTGIDLINYVETDDFIAFIAEATSGSASGSVQRFPVSQGVTSIQGSGTATTAPPPPGTIQLSAVGPGSGNGTLTVGGDLDYDAFPSIPSNAQITKITAKIRYGYSATGVVDGDGNNADLNLDCIGRISLGIQDFLDLNLDVAVDIFDTPGPQNETINTQITFSTQQEVIFGVPLTKAQLIADYTALLITMASITNVDTRSGAGDNNVNDGDLDLAITLDNFQIIITYQSGPELVLNPSGGDVEPGQYINITGPNAAENEYAALQDDKVIPIIPKIIGPNEVEIPVPIPPTDDCTGCLAGDCVQCDTCFDACENDLTSEKCQECVDACLDCLVECLENLELGEDCQQSSQDPPEIPIVIICGGPKFVGSVPLGNFTILIARASGIYRFIPGKTNDTLYATARDGTTYDVAIPKPFGKTGFFRS